MDEQMPQPQQPRSKMILLFVVFLVVSTLILLAGFLNYFNIIHLSNFFPQLGFLPHKTQNTPISSQPTPNYSKFPPNVFKYDTEKAKTTVTKYIKDNIKSEFLPENLDIKQGLSVDNKVDETLKHLFGSYIVNNNETVSITFHYKESTNIPNDYMIFIQKSKTEQTTLNSAVANSLTSSYFINPFQIEDCNTKGTTTYCETFKTENDGKRGFGTIIAQDPSKPPSQLTTFAFSCFIPKESKDYDGMKSCISP